MKPTDLDHIRLLVRPVDEDTRILAAKFIRVDGIPVLFESWSWDGVKGKSAVFLTETVAGMTAAALREFLKDHGVDFSVGGSTIARREIPTFLSFGFEAK